MRKLVILLTLVPCLLFAQNKDEELAAQYYLNGEFEKAAALYEDLLKKKPESTYIYSNYLNTLLAMNDFEKAEKMIRSQIRRFPSNYTYPVDRAWLYTRSNDPEKAARMANELVEELKNDEQAFDLALALIRRGFHTQAEQAFLKGRKLAKDPGLFSGELASLYAAMGKKNEMIGEGIEYARQDPGHLQTIQQLFQDHLSDSADLELLIKVLRQNLNKMPEDGACNELLMWALVQKRDFSAAFVQFRALDKRHNENGRRVMDLAAICLKNADFDNAVRCYEYVITLGRYNSYFYQAQFGLLEVSFNRIAVYNRYQQQDVINAVRAFEKYLNDYGQYTETDFAARNLAHLYLFYMDMPDSAIRILERIANKPGVRNSLRGEVKLDLGDAWLMTGDVWEAELCYSQVDKEFKEEALGQEAKFRMARLFYYKGEFERAAAYLDVLKTATTQLISNNAIALSLLILDNTGLDSSEEAMKLYAAAELFIYRNKVQEGMNLLKELERTFPGHSLQDELLMARAKAMIRLNLPDSAAGYLEEIVQRYPGDILADNALFMLAQLYEYQLNNPQKAMELYEAVLLNYPSSLFSVEARKRYRYLRGDKPDTQENKQILFDRYTN